MLQDDNLTLQTPLDIEKARKVFSHYDWNYLTTPGTYPKINGVSKKRTDDGWLWLGRDLYIWSRNNQDLFSTVARYLKKLDFIIGHSEGVPYGIQKRIARAAAKYNLRIDILDGFNLKEGPGHAAYNFVLNIMRVVPEYYLRFGKLWVGDKSVDEFEKTLLHEFGHVVWHRELSEEQRMKWIEIAPEFVEDLEGRDPLLWEKAKIITMLGQELSSSFYTPVGSGSLFVSNQARMNVKEDFAESFMAMLLAPEILDGKRRKFFEDENIIDAEYEVLEPSPLALPSPMPNDEYVPIDLQFNDRRVELAKKMESLIKDALKGNAIKRLFLYGDYTTMKANPRNIKAVILMLGKAGGEGRAVDGECEITYTNNEINANKMIYEYRSLSTIADQVGGITDKIDKDAVKLPITKGPILSQFTQHYFSPKKEKPHYWFGVNMGMKGEGYVFPRGLPNQVRDKKIGILRPMPKNKGKGKIVDKGAVEVLEWGKDKRKFEIMEGPQRGAYVGVPVDGKKWVFTRLTARDKPEGIMPKLKRYRMKMPHDAWENKRYVLLPRVGGTRVAMTTTGSGARIYSKYLSTKKPGLVERTHNFPHLRDSKLPFTSKTILEGELYLKNSALSNKAMLSLPARARKLQDKHGPADILIHDVLYLNGEDMRKLPYRARMNALTSISGNKLPRRINIAPFITEDKKRAFKIYSKEGFRGGLLVDQEAPYNEVSVTPLLSSRWAKK